jgi:AcrR family transcriptional regulator
MRKKNLERQMPAKRLEKYEPALKSGLQTLRSERTRAALLASAEKVFARDGFEASRIEDIATDAGRSRGAFYANFESKTEVFLELRTRAMQRRAREVRITLTAAKTEAARTKAIYQHILERVCDVNTLLLEIEFKLFALRHPKLRATLAEKHIEASVRVHEEELADFFPHDKKTLAEARRKTLAVEAMLEGFALNALFSPRDLTRRVLESLLPRVLHEILEND